MERLGEPPKKQVVPGAPKRADSSKAVRCCVDWAIKVSGALQSGQPTEVAGGSSRYELHGYQRDFLASLGANLAPCTDLDDDIAPCSSVPCPFAPRPPLSVCVFKVLLWLFRVCLSLA